MLMLIPLKTDLWQDSWVRGRIVPFDRDAIHAYIKDNYVVHLTRFDQFTRQLTKGNQNYDEITIGICEAGKHMKWDNMDYLSVSKDMT